MIGIMVYVGMAILFLQAIIGLSYLISSIYEKEKRAAWFAGAQFLCMAGLLLGMWVLNRVGFFGTGAGIALLFFGYAAGGLAAYVLLRKTGANPQALEGTEGLVRGEVVRFDEREQVFARNRSLRPASAEYEAFYREHPEYEDYDTKRRARGGALGTMGLIDGASGKVNVNAAVACASLPLALSTPAHVKPQPASNPAYLASSGKDRTKPDTVVLSPEEAARRVKGYALQLGADLVGIAEVNPSWVYSRRGEIFNNNWEDWGQEIDPGKFAIVFATEMRLNLICSSPHTSSTIETMRNYSRGAVISTQLAGFIANMGYSATANHLRYWDNLVVPLAVDAGLGEMGRLGYLMTKEFGPRIRLAAVTTDMPLAVDKPVDIGAVHFCEICKKCALCCPSRSIPTGERSVVNGTLRWKLNDETCFDYWGRIGTDCNICMRVCPWSHARTFPHKVIVELIARNKNARRLFSIMDDIFYGKSPKSKEPPEWAAFKK